MLPYTWLAVSFMDSIVPYQNSELNLSFFGLALGLLHNPQDTSSFVLDTVLPDSTPIANAGPFNAAPAMDNDDSRHVGKCRG